MKYGEIEGLVNKSNYLRDNFKPSVYSISRRKISHGVGINDSDYMVSQKIDGCYVVCPAYSAWNSMIKRSYNPKIKSKHKTYADVSVCEEWHSFMAFRGWWVEHQVDGWQLDKDLLTDSKTYSPSTCIFIPQWLNKFTTDHRNARGDSPIGASLHGQTGKYQSTCSNPITGRLEYLGLFKTQDEAHLVWLKRKLRIASDLKESIDAIDGRIYDRVISIITNLK